MPKLRCDLHIHTALSPCATQDMIPRDIINMALLVGAQAIAVTDHNNAANARALVAAAGDRLIVVPGVEAWSSEDVHLLCLFGTVEAAEAMGRLLFQSLPDRLCNTEIYGHQLLFDADSKIIGWEDRLLLSPTKLCAAEICRETRARGGVIIPAHVDKSYGMVAQLGLVPPELEIKIVEISKRGAPPAATRHLKHISNSDSHNLTTLAASNPWELEVSLASAAGIIDALSKY